MALFRHHEEAPSGLFSRTGSLRRGHHHRRRAPASAPGATSGTGSTSSTPNRHELMRRELGSAADDWSDSSEPVLEEQDENGESPKLVRSATEAPAPALDGAAPPDPSRPPSQGSLRLDDVVRAASAQTTVTAPPLAQPLPAPDPADLRSATAASTGTPMAPVPGSPFRPISATSQPALIRSASPAKPAEALVSQASASGHTPLRVQSPAVVPRNGSPLVKDASPAQSRSASQQAVPQLVGERKGGEDEISEGLRNALSTALDTTRLAPADRPPEEDESDSDASPWASTRAWEVRRASSLEHQITGFAVASSKRNVEFHAIFSDAPEDDYLIEDYGCALVRDILHQGRLYISENHLCFNSSLFGWVTNIVVPFADIVSIEKRNTALVIPNAITVATLTAKYTFASFLSRDATYEVIVNIWKLSHPSLANGHAGRETDDERGGAEATAEAYSRARLSKRARLRRKFMERHERRPNRAIGSDVEAADSDDESSEEDVVEEVAAHPTGKTGKPKRRPRPATECEDGKQGQHYPNVVLDATYPTSVETLHNLLFTTDFVRTFLVENQKVFDVEMGDWEPGEAGTSRSLSYIKPLNASIGPKQAKCVITECALHVDPEKYTTTITTTRTPDVPSGGSFAVKTRTCLTWAGGWRTRLQVTCTVEWTGRSFIRGVIDRASIEGQKEYYAALNTAIERYMHAHANEFKDATADPAEQEEEEEAAEEEAEDEVEDKLSVLPASRRASGASAAGAGAGAGPAPRTLWARYGGPVWSMCAEGVGVLREQVAGASPSTLLLGGAVVLLVILNVWAMGWSGRGARRGTSWADRARQEEALLGQAMRQALHHALFSHDEPLPEGSPPGSEVHRLAQLLERQEKQVQALRSDLARVLHWVEHPEAPAHRS